MVDVPYKHLLVSVLLCICIIGISNAAIPVSNFTANQTIGYIYPMAVQFYDNSTNVPTSWNWSFGDGRYSSSQHPVYQYAVAGKYRVNLTATNADGSNTTSKSQYINLTSDVDSNVISWLHMNGTEGSTSFIGESGVAWSTSGAAKITQLVYKYGNSSGDFTGPKSYIWTPHIDAANYSSNLDFTIEMWVRPTSTGIWYPIFQKGPATLTAGYGVYHSTNSANSDGWKFYMGDYNTGSTGTFSLPLNTWSHLVVERWNGTAYVFVNGTLVAFKTGVNNNYDTTYPIYLGYSPNKYYVGYLDEARVSKGVARWKTNFTPPYNQYAGNLETAYPDTNLNSTLRFKTTPPDPAPISNTTPRNRTIQIQNVNNINYIAGSVWYDSDATEIIGVRVNNSYYTNGLTLVSYVIEPSLELVEFNVTKNGTGFNGGTDRVSFLDIEMAYINYEDPATEEQEYEFFGYGRIVNATTNITYPVHNFIPTNLTYLDWTFTANFTANNTTPVINQTVAFNSTFIGSYPNRWNWSWGDGTFTDGSEPNVTHTYTHSGLKTVSVLEYLYENVSVNSSKTRINYINVTGEPITDFIANETIGIQYPMAVQFNCTCGYTPTMWNWSFGDGRWLNGSYPTPVYQYAVAGKYNVTLIASNSYGSNSSTKIEYINLTKDIDPYVVSWMHFNAPPSQPFADEIGLLWTLYDTPTISTTTYQFPTGSGSFTAAKSGLHRYSYATLNFLDRDFTLEFWYLPVSQQTNGHVLTRTNSALSDGWGLINTNGTENGYVFFMGDSAVNSSTPFRIPNNQWSQVVIERLDSVIYVYLDGTLTVVKNGVSGSFDVAADEVKIAYGGSGNIKQVYGYFDELRISNGIARWRSNFTTPYAQYRGLVENYYPDINPDSTFRFKIDPSVPSDPDAYIYNNSVHGRTLQIQNITHADYIVGSITTDPKYTALTYVQPNTSAYSDITIVSSSINNNYGILEFNITRPGGFTTLDQNRKSVLEWGQVYINYSAQESEQPVYFTYGKLINTSANQVYPIHHFLSTNLSYGEWSFVAGLTANKTDAYLNEPVQFTGTFTGATPNMWNWSFGDGTFSDNGVSTTHAYSTYGLKTVTVTAYMWQNTNINSTYTRTDYINVTSAPTTNFVGSPTVGYAPLVVSFSDVTLGLNNAWNWSFGDGTYSDQKNPVHNYTASGTYTVILTVGNERGYDTMTRQNYITAYTPNISPSAGFIGSPTFSTTVPTVVSFSDISTGLPTSWDWSFGDGSYSTVQNPIHTYSGYGNYTVSLTAINAYGYDTLTRTGYIYIPFPPTPTPTPAPSTVVGNQTIIISAEISEKYINWRFSPVNSSEPLPLLDIYIDDSDVPVVTNYTGSTYLMSDLLPGERHNIRLYNASAVYESNVSEFAAKATAKTSNAGYEVMFLVALNLLLGVLLFILKDLKYISLMGSFNIGISLIGISLTGTTEISSYIFIGVAVMSGIMILVNGLPRLKEEISWI